MKSIVGSQIAIPYCELNCHEIGLLSPTQASVEFLEITEESEMEMINCVTFKKEIASRI